MKALAALTYSGFFLCFLIASKTSSFIRITKHNSYSRYLKILLVPLSILFLSAAVLATHNPSVSHSADNVVNGTFRDNYTFISYAQNATPIIIRGNDTQLANLTVWQTFAGVPLASINATGSWRMGGAGTPVLFIDNNTGSVGIGTVSPTTKTEIRIGARTGILNASNISTWADLTLVNPTDTQNAAVGIRFNVDASGASTGAGAGIVGIKTHATGDVYDLAFITDVAGGDPTERMRITETGSVGVGATSPNASLHVVGTGTGGGLRVTNQTNGAEVFFVNSTLGAVGIGTATPSQKLEISGNTWFRGSIGLESDSPQTNTMIAGRLLTTNPTAATRAIALIRDGAATTGSNANLVKGAFFSVRAADTNTQNWTGSYPFQAIEGKVEGMAGASGTVSGMVNFLAVSPIDSITLTNWYGMYIEAPTGSGTITNKYAFVSEPGAGSVGIGTTAPTAKLHINTTNSTGGNLGLMTDVLRITGANATEFLFVNGTSGRVGIGTTAPGRIFVINSATLPVASLYLSGTEYGTFGIAGTAGDWFTGSAVNDVSLRSDNSDLWIGTTATGNNPIRFATNNSQRAIIDSSGRVGIGATSPNATLHILGTGTAGGLRVTNQSNAAEVFFVNSTLGSVGIGTTGPAEKLDVRNGAIRVGYDTDTYDELIAFYRNAIQIGSISNTGNELTIAAANNKNVYIVDDTGVGTAGITVRDGGNVGIGAITPNATLHVLGTGVAGGLRVTNQSNAAEVFFVNSTLGMVGIGTASPTAKLNVVGTTGNGLTIDMSSGYNFISFNTASVNKWIQYLSGNDFRFYEGGADRVTLQSGGRVGIGTTAPYRRLQVNGTGGVSLEANESVYLATGAGQLVGINTTSPRQTLTVRGDANVTGILYVGSQSFTNIDASGNLIVGDAARIGGSVNITGNLSINGTLWQPIYPTDDGLVLYLPFSEGNASGGRNITYDRSPYGNDGTLTNMNTTGNNMMNGSASGWTTGKYGNALGFDGVDDYVDVPSSSVFDIAQGSIEAWVKFNQAGIRYDYLEVLQALYTDFIDLQRLTTNKIRIEMEIGNVNQIALVSDTTISDANWHHIVATQDGTAAKIYIDGAESTTSGTNSGAWMGNFTSWGITIGKSHNALTNGSVDEVRIYNRVLSADEIRTHYLRGSGFGASGAITADKFRIVNTTGSRIFDVNRTALRYNDTTLYVDALTSRVGIGTSAPYARLMVNGTTPALQVNDSAYLAVSGGRVGINTTNPASTLSVVGNFSVTGNDNSSIDGSTLFIDAANNRVGIGVTNPGTFLTVSTRVDILSSGGDPLLLLGDSIAAGDYGYYQWNSANDQIRLGTNTGGDTMTITEGGLVGIGAISPNSTLHILGTGTGGGLRVTNQSNAAEVFFVNSTLGAVGIGVTNPDQLLTVGSESTGGTISSLGTFTIQSGTAANLNLKSNGAADVLINYNAGDDLIFYGGDTTEDFKADADGSGYFRGNVGIGTTAPYRRLQVNGTGGVSLEANESVYLATGAGALVGINTTSPRQALTVKGDANVTGTLYVGSQSFTNIDASGNLVVGDAARVGGSVNITGNLSINGTLWQPIYPTDDGLVLYLPFSEGNASGGRNITYDRSPYGNDGTLTNMNTTGNNKMNGSASGWTTGKYGNALGFDGVDDYVSASDAPSLDFNSSDSFSLSAWIKTSTTGVIQQIMMKGQDSGITYYPLYRFEVTAGNKALFLIASNLPSNSAPSITGDTTITDGNWHHVAAVRDRAAANLKIYVDGISDATPVAESTALDLSSTQDLQIGRDYRDGSYIRYFNGSIDEVRVYNRALSVDEIRTQYLGGLQAHGTVVADKFRIVNTTASELLRVTNNGSVGIGTTGPASTLQIGSITHGSAALSIIRDTSGGIDDMFNLQANGNAAANRGIRMTFYTPGGSNNVLSGSITLADEDSSNPPKTYMAFGTHTGTALGEKMRITSGGNVGIGTTAPYAKLMVNGTTPALQVNDSAYLAVSGGRVGINTTNPASTLSVVGNFSVTGNDNSSIDGSTLFIDAANDRVGIGTASPIQAFHVSGNIALEATDPNFYFRRAGSYKWSLYTDSTSGDDLQLYGYPGSGYIMRWDSENGNVGIGTTAPYRRLQVNGTGGVSLEANESVYLATIGNQLVGIGTIAPFAGLMINKTTPALQVNDSAYLAVSGGRVGIGTTAPFSKLHILGNATIEGNVSINGTLWQPVYPTDDGLVLYLPFSEGNASGGRNITYDRSPYGNDGTLTNMNTTGNNKMNGSASGWTTGKYGNALGFDGVDDYVKIPASATIFDFTASPFSIEFWVYPRALTDPVVLVNRGADQADGYIIQTTTDGSINFRTSQASASQVSNTGAGALPLNTWKHVVVTRNGSAATIYINSVDLTTTRATHLDPLTANRALVIGIHTDEVNYRFNGTIDEVRIYNRALSADEIRTQYLGGLQSHGTITADKFRVVNTTGSRIFDVNRTALRYNDTTLYVDALTSSVGIGTLSPTTKTEIKIGARTSTFSAVDTSTWADLTLVNPTDTQNAAVGIRFNVDSSGANVNTGAGIVAIKTHATGDVYDLAFLTDVEGGDPTERMRITSGGNVGIGTVSPLSKLHVEGNLTINGTATYLTEWYNGTASIANNKVVAVNSTGALCFGSSCSGQIFFNGTAMVIRVV